MRLVSFGPCGQERLGALIAGGEQILDLHAADREIPATMLEFLRGDFWGKARRVLADTLPGGCGDRQPVSKQPETLTRVSPRSRELVSVLEGVRLGAPVPHPGQIVCLGLNYKDHADEQGVAYPKAPLLFSKSPMAAAGPGDDVVYPDGVEQLDYEVELAVIMGRTAKRVPAAQARQYIAGYCVLNDVSARCCQFGDKQWFRGKSFDTFAPCGPALVTPDEAPDPHSLKLTCKVNGELRQNSNTNQLIHRIEDIIAYITRGITLLPGDVISTGTPSGVGVFFKPPRLLKRGDVVEAEIEGLGKLVNRIV